MSTTLPNEESNAPPEEATEAPPSTIAIPSGDDDEDEDENNTVATTPTRSPSERREAVRASILSVEDGSARGITSTTSPPPDDAKSSHRSLVSAVSTITSSSVDDATMSRKREKWETSYGRSIGRCSGRLDDQEDGGEEKVDVEKAVPLDDDKDKVGDDDDEEDPPTAVPVDDPEDTPQERPLPISARPLNNDTLLVHATAVPLEDSFRDDEEGPMRTKPNPFRDRRVVLCIVVGLAVIVGLVCTLVVRRGSSDDSADNAALAGEQPFPPPNDPTDSEDLEDDDPTSGRPPFPKTLTMPLNGNHTEPGAMFDIQAKTDLYITGLYIYSLKNAPIDDLSVYVWTKEGSYVNFTHDSSDWTAVHNDKDNKALPRNANIFPRPIELNQGKRVENGPGRTYKIGKEKFGKWETKAGETRAFYLVIVGSDRNDNREGVVLSYDDDMDEGDMLAENDDLAVMVGVGMGNSEPFGGSSGGGPRPPHHRRLDKNKSGSGQGGSDGGTYGGRPIGSMLTQRSFEMKKGNGQPMGFNGAVSYELKR